MRAGLCMSVAAASGAVTVVSMPANRGLALRADIPFRQRRDGFSQLVVRREYSVIPMPVLPRRRHKVRTTVGMFAAVVAAQDAPPTAVLPSLPRAGGPNAAADTSAEDAARLERSLAAWAEVKAACGGSYSYIVRFTSAFGFGHATTITVRDNLVIERKFEQWGRPGPGKPPVAEIAWVETVAEIGSHADAGATPARTVDELYVVAKTVVETEPAPHHVRSLGIDLRGLLQHCSIRDTRIADDGPENGVPPFELTLAAE